MDSIEASLLTLKFEVARLAQEMPDYKYVRPKSPGSCYYSKGGCEAYPNSIGCIIGQATRNVWPELYKYLIVKDIEVFSVDFCEYINHQKVTVRSLDIIDWLSRIQTRQDSGDTWNQSLKYVS